MNKIIDSIKNCPLAPGQTGIWYLGQEGFLFRHNDQYLLIDPYLSYFADENCCQFVKWERLYPAPVKAEELDFIDTILVTHNHGDHADPDTLPVLMRINPNARLVVPAPEKQTIAGFGIPADRIIGAYADTSLEFGDFRITPIPSAHETFHRDADGNYHELGYILDTGDGRFFHSGDMCMYEGLMERLTDLDIAFLPINGRDWFRNRDDIIGNFNCEEAVLLAKAVGAKMLVPMHYDLYKVNQVSPITFMEVLNRLNPGQATHMFVPGERYIFAR